MYEKFAGQKHKGSVVDFHKRRISKDLPATNFFSMCTIHFTAREGLLLLLLI
jgi:hypothetical protein